MTTDHQFRVSFVVPEKRLGAVLAQLNNAPGLNVELITQRPSENNLPRGAVGEAIKQAIAAAAGKAISLGELTSKLRERGFPGTTIHSCIYRLVDAKEVKKTGKGSVAMISLTSKGEK